MTTVNPHNIQHIVSRAMEAAVEQSGGSRLVPFTAAEMRFIQQVVTQTLTELLAQPAGRA